MDNAVNVAIAMSDGVAVGERGTVLSYIRDRKRPGGLWLTVQTKSGRSISASVEATKINGIGKLAELECGILLEEGVHEGWYHHILILEDVINTEIKVCAEKSRGKTFPAIYKRNKWTFICDLDRRKVHSVSNGKLEERKFISWDPGKMSKDRALGRRRLEAITGVGMVPVGGSLFCRITDGSGKKTVARLMHEEQSDRIRRDGIIDPKKVEWFDRIEPVYEKLTWEKQTAI
jgi:hypothetical protein